MLQGFSQILQQSCRTSDVLSRFGGDEFCVLLTDTPIKGATDVAERIRARTEGEQFAYQNARLQLTSSVGVGSYASNIATRGLTPETIVDFGLGHCAKGMMAGRIAIPIHNADGKVVAYAGRWPGEPAEDTPKYKLPPGFRKSLELFNLDRACKEPGPLIIVEGFFGAMKLWQHGVRKVVALMGSTLSVAQEELIRRHTDRTSQVIVLLDEDEAGRAGREDIAVRLAKIVFVKVHTFDEEGQQPENLSADEVLKIVEGVP